MRRIGRWIFISATALSLLLLLTTAALWTWTRAGHRIDARLAPANTAILALDSRAKSGQAYISFVAPFSHPGLTGIWFDRANVVDLPRGLTLNVPDPVSLQYAHEYALLGGELWEYKAEVWVSTPSGAISRTASLDQIVRLTCPFWLPTLLFASPTPRLARPPHLRPTKAPTRRLPRLRLQPHRQHQRHLPRMRHTHHPMASIVL